MKKVSKTFYQCKYCENVFKEKADAAMCEINCLQLKYIDKMGKVLPRYGEGEDRYTATCCNCNTKLLEYGCEWDGHRNNPDYSNVMVDKKRITYTFKTGLGRDFRIVCEDCAKSKDFLKKLNALTRLEHELMVKVNNIRMAQ